LVTTVVVDNTRNTEVVTAPVVAVLARLVAKLVVGTASAEVTTDSVGLGVVLETDVVARGAGELVVPAIVAREDIAGACVAAVVVTGTAVVVVAIV
jgi:hypothetical protein